MRLLSETLPLGLPGGPVFPKAYPDIEPDAFSNSDHFLQGQPFDIYARLRAEAPVAMIKVWARIFSFPTCNVKGRLLRSALTT